MAHISDRLPEPFDRKLIISWNKLTSKSKNTLWRALERSNIWDDSFVEGFNFELMSKISIEELNDARFIGPARAAELIQELVSIFDDLALKKDLDSKKRSHRFFPTKSQSEAIHLASEIKRTPTLRNGPRRFPTKAELHAIKLASELKATSVSKKNSRLFPTKAEFEAARAAARKFSETAETKVPFEGCTTFSELFEELDRELLKLPKVDGRALAMMKHRHQAFGEPGLTLDDIGKEWGVTRERVRQIVDPLMKARIHLENEVPMLLKAVEIFEECEDEDEFRGKVADDEMFSGEDISWQRLWGLTQILSSDVLANRVYEKHLELESESGANSPIRGSIKKVRSKFGLYDLKVVSRKYEVNQDKAFKIISELYPRSIRSGSLVLARTKNMDTMFENSIAKQLKVSSPLEVKELLKGLQRTGKQRDVSLIGSTEDLSNLILGLVGNPPNYETASKGLIKQVDFQTLEKWLIEIFSEVNLGILHSNDVVNFALRDRRINVSSVTVYLLNSPIMRSHGRSLYSLVGTEVTEDQLDAYIQIIRGSSEASEVSYEMTDASKGILSVKPNLNVITSGIVFPPSGYKKIFEGFEFETFCSCGQLETIQAVKFAPSGFWTGFTAMIRHGFSEHQMSKGSTFRFEFDFDESIVRLLAN